MSLLAPSAEAFASQALVVTLATVYVGGVVVSFTPCTYPMVPIVASVIGGSAAGTDRRRAALLTLVFVLGMAVVYAGLGVIAALGGDLLFGAWSNHPYSLGIVALVLALLALVMADLIVLPVTGVAGDLPRRLASGGNYAAIFAAGGASALVAAPCTAPVMFALLAWIAATGSALLGFTAMFVFALGLGTLLMLVGMFSGLLTSLPRSGAWMNTIKRGLALLLLLGSFGYTFQAGVRHGARSTELATPPGAAEPSLLEDGLADPVD